MASESISEKASESHWMNRYKDEEYGLAHFAEPFRKDER
jgi:hypothetical protein